MAGEYNLGTARGKIEIDSSGLTQGVQDAQRSWADLRGDLQNSSSFLNNVGNDLDRLGGRIVGAFGLVAKGVGLAVAGITGVSLWGGLQRVLDTEDARKLFGQMGNDAEAVDGILEGLNETFLKGPFAYPDVYDVGAQLMASGTAMEDLNEQTLNAGNLAAFSNTEFDRIGNILVKIGAQGRVTGNELTQLAEAGVPIRDILADGLGVTVDELNEMVSAGELSSDMFHDVLSDTDMLTGAMESMADTTRGAWTNLKTGIAGAGEALLAPWFGENGTMVGFLHSINDLLYAQVIPALQEFGEWLNTTGMEYIQGTLVPALQSLWEIISTRIIPVIQTIIGWFQRNSEAIGQVLRAMLPAAAILGGFATAIHVLRRAWVLLQAATPLGMLFLLISALIYAWQHSETFRNIVTTAFEVVQEVVGRVVEFVSGLIERVTGLFEGSGESAASMSERIGEAWQAVQDFIAPIVDWFTEHVGPVFEELGDLISAVWDRISEAISITWEIIQDNVEAGLLFVRALWNQYGAPLEDTISEMWTQVQNTIEVIWNVIRTIIETALGVIRGIIQTVTGLIRGDWSEVWEGIKTILESVWTGIRTIVTTAIGFVLTTIFRVLNNIRNAWNTAWEAVSTKLTTVWRGIQTALTVAITALMTKVRSIKDRILNFFSNAGQWLISAGRNILEGLLDGLRAGWETVSGWVSNVGGWIQDLKGPLSTDRKLLVKQGGAIIEGLMKGLGEVWRDNEKFFGEIVKDIETGLSGVESSLASFAQKAKREASTYREAMLALAYETGQSSYRMIGDLELTKDQVWSLVDTARSTKDNVAQQARGLAESWASELEKVNETVEGVKTQFANALTVIASHLGNYRAYLSTFVGLTADQMEELAKTIDGFAKSMASSFQQVTSVVGKFGNASEVNKDEILDFFRDQVKNAASWAKDLKRLAKAGIDTGLLEELARGGPKAAPLIRGMLDAVASGGVEAINQAQKDLNKILENTIKSVGAQLQPSWIEGIKIGESIGEGIGEGIANQSSALQKQIRALTRALVRAAKQELKIKSPSAIFADIGEEVGAGLLVGISTLETKLLRLMVRLADELGDTFRNSADFDVMWSTIDTPKGISQGTSAVSSSVDNSSALSFYGDIVLPNITDRSSAEDLLNSLTQAVRQGAR